MGRLAALPRAYWGMVLAHCGVALFIVGVTMVKGFEVEQDVRMNVGETATLGGYTFRFDGTQQVNGPNYVAARGTFHVSQDGREVTVMYPEKRRYFVQNQTMTEAAIPVAALILLIIASVSLFGDAAALLVLRAGVSSEAALLLAPLVSALVAAPIAWFAVRLSGVYLAMLTLAFAQIVWSICFQWDDFTGGSNGITGVWPSAWLQDKAAYYWLTLVLVALSVMALRRVLMSPLGYALRASAPIGCALALSAIVRRGLRRTVGRGLIVVGQSLDGRDRNAVDAQ